MKEEILKCLYYLIIRKTIIYIIILILQIRKQKLREMNDFPKRADERTKI